MRPLGLLLGSLCLTLSLSAQEPAPTPAPAPVEGSAPIAVPTAPPAAIPALIERNLLPPAEVAYVHPLYRPVDTPARLQERPTPLDFERRTQLAIAVRVDETGKAGAAVAVEPPLLGLVDAIRPLPERWRFTPARQGGRAVPTWATVVFDLDVELEKAAVQSFVVAPIPKDQPLPPLVREATGDTWMARYPKEIAPPDAGAVSIEQVETLPNAEKLKWDFDTTRKTSEVTALLLVGAGGQVRRLVPTGGSAEPLIVAWLRQAAATWKFTPAVSGGSPVDSWVTLQASFVYTISSAKERGKRVIKKNLRSTPAE